jgi:hypothetical protein
MDHDVGEFASGFAAGSRISGYRLERQIGRGGMAVVFRARDEHLGRLVALKILAPALAGDEAFQRRFVSESRAAAAIDDPHIVPVFAAGEADGVLFIAMRYVAGGDVQSLMSREGPLPAARVASVISPVASALDAAHAAGLLHRDVKPSNMLIDAQPGRPDHVYLSDFGLSKATAATSGMTMTGEVIGTVHYLSPEQIEGDPPDGRADQYALACAAFAMLTGEPPFTGDNPTAVMYAHRWHQPPLVTARRPDLPAAADAVLAKALAKTRDGRYANCGEFADALRVALGFEAYRAGPRARTVPPPHPVREVPAPTMTAVPLPGALSVPDRQQWRPGRGLIAVASAAAVIVVAGVLAAALLPGSSSSHARGGGHAAPPAPASVPVPIAAKSSQAPVGGYVFVNYLSGKLATAEISGEISKAVNGEVVRLYAQQFPFTGPPVAAGETLLQPTGGAASYEFQVTPSLATHYHVELFRSSTASTPLGTSHVTTVYVGNGGTDSKIKTCSPDEVTCHQTLQATVVLPPSVLAVEMAKPTYVYFAINRSLTSKATEPRVLALGAGGAHASAWRRVGTDELSVTVTLTFSVGISYYWWVWNWCTKDTEATDGIGLPGSHGCGAPSVAETAAYLG